METREILLGARKLLEDPDNWMQGAFYRKVDGHCCYCVLGACLAVTGYDIGRAPVDWGLHDRLVEQFEPIVSEVSAFGIRNIAVFNDDQDTTHADILLVLDRAIAKAEGQS